MDRDKAIRNVYPNVVSVFNGVLARDGDGNEVNLDEDLVQSELDALQAAHDAFQYSRDRQGAYPPFADQFDQIFHEGIDKWKETIQAVKDAHPKP